MKIHTASAAKGLPTLKSNDMPKLYLCAPTEAVGALFALVEGYMNKRVALIGIVVEDKAATARLNELLSEYGDFIIGRMGLPHKERGISVISVVIDAPQDTIAALSGKLGALPGVTSKTIYSKVGDASE